jgi:hypothetical protein
LSYFRERKKRERKSPERKKRERKRREEIFFFVGLDWTSLELPEYVGTNVPIGSFDEQRHAMSQTMMMIAIVPH